MRTSHVGAFPLAALGQAAVKVATGGTTHAVVNGYTTVRDLLSQEAGISLIAKAGLTRQTIYRIKEPPHEAEAALAAWGL